MNLTPNEVLIILVVALIVLGPTRLPDAVKTIAKGFREVRKVSNTVRHEIDSALGEPVREIQDAMRGVDSSPAPSAPTTSPPSITPNAAFRPADEIDDAPIEPASSPSGPDDDTGEDSHA